MSFAILKTPPHKTYPINSRRRRSQAITLIEVIVSIFIFAMMTMMFSAVVPSALRSARYTGTYGRAVAITTRKIDQLVEAGYNRLNTNDLKSLGIVDSTAPTTSGSATIYTFTNNTTAANANNADNLASFFPKGVTGTIRIEGWTPSTRTVNNISQQMLRQATVTINWREPGGAPQSYSVSTVIPQMTVN